MVHVVVERDDDILCVRAAPSSKASNGRFCIVADVSFSMDAQIRRTTVDEQSGEMKEIADVWSRLNVTQHSMQVFVATLEETDAVCICSFADECRVDLDWTACTAEGKARALCVILGLTLRGCTNLKSAYEIGANQFALAQVGPLFASSLIVLTDGEPTLDLPWDEYRAAIRRVAPATLHVTTVGIGNSVISDLLEGVSDAFLHMPDPNAIAPTMVNLVAHCKSIARADDVALTKVFLQLDDAPIHIGGLKCKQTRHVLAPNNGEEMRIRAFVGNVPLEVEVRRAQGATDAPTRARERLRAAAIKFLSSESSVRCEDLDALLRAHNAAEASSMYQTLTTEVRLALTPEKFRTWGQHFLRALHLSLVEERRCNFQDSCAQQWPGEVEEEWCAHAELQFAQLTPPKARYAMAERVTNVATATPATMTPDMLRGGGCFHPETRIALAGGESRRIADVSRGDVVKTPHGVTAVKTVIVTWCRQGAFMCVLDDGTMVTPYHPVRNRDTNAWIMPASLAGARLVACTCVVNLVLEGDHEVIVDNGRVCVTMGHGKQDSVVKHPFWGHGVLEAIESMPKDVNGAIHLESALVAPVSG